MQRPHFTHAYRKAGTVSLVSINLIGKREQQSTGYLMLGDCHKFQPGQVEQFNILADDVGLPTIIDIKLSNQSKVDEWFCDQITVTLIANGLQANFPVHDWVLDGTEITRGDDRNMHDSYIHKHCTACSGQLWSISNLQVCP
ncbi:unnamed protein product [Clavelina lepadiformis]|uniref:PLAT domain-containing protein n=1 Tax=Clavelina lepadiformis TaxID=159417 RepID=A0ABP0FHD1_CLALP